MRLSILKLQLQYSTLLLNFSIQNDQHNCKFYSNTSCFHGSSTYTGLAINTGATTFQTELTETC